MLVMCRQAADFSDFLQSCSIHPRAAFHRGKTANLKRISSEKALKRTCQTETANKSLLLGKLAITDYKIHINIFQKIRLVAGKLRIKIESRNEYVRKYTIRVYLDAKMLD